MLQMYDIAPILFIFFFMRNWVKCKVASFWIPWIFLFVCLSNYSSNLLRFSTWIKLTALSGEELHIAINCYSSVVLIQLKFNLKEKLLNESELLIFKVFPRLHRLWLLPCATLHLQVAEPSYLLWTLLDLGPGSDERT